MAQLGLWHGVSEPESDKLDDFALFPMGEIGTVLLNFAIRVVELGHGTSRVGGDRSVPTPYQNGNLPPPRPFIMSFMPPAPPSCFIMLPILVGDFIILRISPNCLMSWLTSISEVPEPAAMR